jgi:hypothetical protein
MMGTGFSPSSSEKQLVNSRDRTSNKARGHLEGKKVFL